MIRWFRKLFTGDALGYKLGTPSSSFAGSELSRADTPYMKAVKLGLKPPVIKRGWLSGYYVNMG